MSKRLEWSLRAERDLELIVAYYAEAISPHIAEIAQTFILNAIANLAARPVLHRPGRQDTRECVLRRFPYTIIYRASGNTIRIVRVLHHAREYFNR